MKVALLLPRCKPSDSAGIPKRTGDAEKRANRIAGRAENRGDYTAVVAGRIATLAGSTAQLESQLESHLKPRKLQLESQPPSHPSPGIYVAADIKKAMAMTIEC